MGPIFRKWYAFLAAVFQSTAAGDGASLIAFEDAGDYYTSDDVEGALQEVGVFLFG